MDTEIWIVLAGLVAVLLVIGTILQIVRGEGKPPRLTVRFPSPLIRPHTRRHEWTVELTAIFQNIDMRRLAIGAASARVVAKGKDPLDAKRLLAEPAGTRHHARVHPPDIALALPIEVGPGTEVRYRFLIFFSSHIRHYWNDGELILSILTVNKAVFEGSCPLSPPAQ